MQPSHVSTKSLEQIAAAKKEGQVLFQQVGLYAGKYHDLYVETDSLGI